MNNLEYILLNSYMYILWEISWENERERAYCETNFDTHTIIIQIKIHKFNIICKKKKTSWWSLLFQLFALKIYFFFLHIKFTFNSHIKKLNHHHHHHVGNSLDYNIIL